MDPLIAGAVTWLLDKSMASLFDTAKNALLTGMGLISTIKPASPKDVQSLLDQYVHRLEQEIQKVGEKLDQDRLALLKGAFSQVKMAPLTKARESFLAHALNTFHTIVNLPQQGRTGTWRNAELRCVAFLGMAAAHIQLNDSPQLVAENLVRAIQADFKTAEQWLGTKVVDVIVRKYPFLKRPVVPPHLLGEITRHLEEQHYDMMISLAEQAINIDPADATFYFYKGLALSNLQRHSEALSAFEEAAFLDPKEALYPAKRGDELTELKRYSEALAAYEQALSIEPQLGSYDNMKAWEGKSEVLQRLGMKQEAKEARQKAGQSRALREKSRQRK